MITLHYPGGSTAVEKWKERLDQLFMHYELIEQGADTLPLLVDGELRTEGTDAIELYLDKLAQFVAGWYEDRCDRYDFDADSTP